jgi:hypothetical protein
MHLCQILDTAADCVKVTHCATLLRARYAPLLRVRYAARPREKYAPQLRDTRQKRTSVRERYAPQPQEKQKNTHPRTFCTLRNKKHDNTTTKHNSSNKQHTTLWDRKAQWGVGYRPAIDYLFIVTHILYSSISAVAVSLNY